MTLSARARGKLIWTREKPTVPGWYWWRRRVGHKAFVVYLEEHDGAMMEYSQGRYFTLENGEWAGPLAEPKEGK
jgi:hypothetical protein